MTLQEFNQLTGLNATENEFENINEMYMAAGEMDKATFCKEYKQHGKSQLAAELMEAFRLEQEEVDKAYEYMHKRNKERDQLVDFLLEQSQELGSTALQKKAIDMIGHTYVIRRKIELGLTLCELDLEYISKNLE